MNELNVLSGIITGIHCEEIYIEDSFLNIASRFACQNGTVVLMSGGSLDSSRYHILGIRPWLTLRGKGEKIFISYSEKELSLTGNPFDILKTVLNSCGITGFSQPLPVGSGLFGYLSYDLKDRLESLPRTSIDDLDLPDIYLCSPSIILIHDMLENKNWVCRPEGLLFDSLLMEDIKRILNSETGPETKHKYDGLAKSPRNVIPAKAGIHNYLKKLDSPIKSGNDKQRKLTLCESIKYDNSGSSGHVLSSNFTQPLYEDTIRKIREYIASGDVYQVNMTQRFNTDFKGDPFTLFKSLYMKNPAPFFAYINAGDHHIISTSPERFLKQTGRRIESRPIKGTVPRGRTEAEDKEMKNRLEASKKDDAELSMIVDLMRNDIGKVCEASSVRVVEHKRVEAYENVYHLVSIVEGDIDKKYDSTDLIKATFPGGSITGCPKIRAMEIIDELEPNRRHAYTGAIGYISFHDTMDLSIAIRIATVYNDRIFFSVGGGVVYDSVPIDEYQETIHKGKTIMETLNEKNKGNPKQEIVWINGSLRPVEQAGVNITDLGLQYGYGFFETIRVDSGIPQFLEDHMERFNHAWRFLFGHNPPDLTWNDIVQRVIKGNGLENETVALKIIATWGDRHTPPYSHTICVLARPYVHRLKGREKKGLRLGIYPDPHCSPLADYKTLNYLYYFMAGRWAANNGYDEAITLNSDWSVSETNTANILLMNGGTVIQPVSPHVLPGVMEKNVLRFLEKKGYSIKRKKVMAEDLFSADSVIITNSLIGAVPVLSIDGKDLKTSNGLMADLGKLNEYY